MHVLAHIESSMLNMSQLHPCWQGTANAKASSAAVSGGCSASAVAGASAYTASQSANCAARSTGAAAASGTHTCPAPLSPPADVPGETGTIRASFPVAKGCSLRHDEVHHLQLQSCLGLNEHLALFSIRVLVQATTAFEY